MKAPWLFCWVGEVSPEHPGMTRRRVRAGIPRTARKGGRSGDSSQPKKAQQELPASTRIAAK